MADKTFRVPPELQDVAEQVGAFIEYWGFKNVHGRIWTHLFLSPEPLDAGDLIDRLGVSKALISMSISDLLGYEVIQVAGKSARATVTYRANPDVTKVISSILRKRERRMLSRISSATRVLKHLPEAARGSVPLAEDRMECLQKMVDIAASNLDGMLQLADVSFHEWTGFDEIPKPTNQI